MQLLQGLYLRQNNCVGNIKMAVAFSIAFFSKLSCGSGISILIPASAKVIRLKSLPTKVVFHQFYVDYW